MLAQLEKCVARFVACWRILGVVITKIYWMLSTNDCTLPYTISLNLHMKVYFTSLMCRFCFFFWVNLPMALQLLPFYLVISSYQNYLCNPFWIKQIHTYTLLPHTHFSLLDFKNSYVIYIICSLHFLCQNLLLLYMANFLIFMCGLHGDLLRLSVNNPCRLY